MELVTLDFYITKSWSSGQRRPRNWGLLSYPQDFKSINYQSAVTQIICTQLWWRNASASGFTNR